MAKQSGISPETFPKIAAEATLKRVTMAEKANLVFDDLEFSPDQYAQLERWRKYKDKIRITIEQIQGHIDQAEEPENEAPLLAEAEKKAAEQSASKKSKPGRKKKDKGMAATVAETENP